ncbi:lysylphosphatidylglycerol synthase domain-containing protein [Polaromonas sp. JS666]|uniref:lysylphosphatidylglycerol synthase domain-containing protein n=1 Tax=Polaromonas sp. (strain JS666 / ATCC BAA-500) TaxID=296591 RepID=UPI0000463CCA|nr:lysylphosphatidylglycerol synthase domain-containing protein [Polaromonas sp. JS666]ABE41991.1 membrane protein, putative [Polaromonas sp. JS666]
MTTSPDAARPAVPAPRRKSRHKFTGKAWWPWLKRGASVVFFALVIGLLVSQARHIEWHQVLTSLQRYPLTAAWGAVLLALTSFALYSTFDLLGRHYTDHTLPAPTVMLVTFISYAFNLNLGSLVGGVAFRFRLYSRLGLPTGVITRIMSLSMLSNWMGYLLLGGLIFSLRPPAVPADWGIDTAHLRLIGFALLAGAAGYLGVCVFSRQRVFWLRGHEIDLPSVRLAGLQLVMGATNWLVMSGIIFILLQHRIEFSAVVSVLLLAAIAGVITHIPGNLGVLEAVFVALLSHQMARHELLAALVAYRVIYYLMPLGIATVAYLIIETRAKKASSPGKQAA